MRPLTSKSVLLRAPPPQEDFQYVYPPNTLTICGPYSSRPALVAPDYAEMRDAAMECEHGRLAFDKIEQTDPCGCWLPIASREIPVPLAPEPKRAAPRPSAASKPRITRLEENHKQLDEVNWLRELAHRVWRAGAAVEAAARNTPLALPARATPTRATPTKGEVMSTDSTAGVDEARSSRDSELHEALIKRLADSAGPDGFLRLDAERELNLEASQTQYILRKMAERNKLVTRGQTSARRYYAPGQAEPNGAKRPAEPARPARSKFDPALRALREEAEQVQGEMERLAERQRMLREAIGTLEALDGGK